jgi:vanillate O-demethylase monooxygenase subunit
MAHSPNDEPAVRFMNNAWYIAGFAEELDATGALARTILSQPLLIMRNPDGSIAAIQDRCPHRLVPLHMGRVSAGQVTCSYHGLAFDGQGKCVHNPHGPTAGLTVASYRAVEVNGLLWVWMGDKAAAHEAAIPAFEQIDEAGYHVRRGYLHGNANYELMTDNILDLSHIEFLHPALGTEAVSRAEVEVVEQDDAIVTTRRMRDETLPEGLSLVYKSGGAIVNRTMEVTWLPPANMVLRVNVEPVDPAQTWRTATQTLHLFTPETEFSTHYFYVGSISRLTGDAETADRFGAALGRAFASEDKPMIDAQARMVGQRDIMDLRPKLLPIDKAGVLARRRLKALIAAEHAQ